MAASSFHIAIPNLPPFIAAIAETPKVQLRFMRGELGRGLKRIRKNFIRTQLHGSPGIHADKLAKGKNVFTFVQGSSLPALAGKIGISRILHVHEKGLTITAKSGGLLYLHAKGRGAIFAAVPKVVIPARLHFVKEVQAEAPAMLRKVGDAGVRATQVTLQKGLLRGARF